MAVKDTGAFSNNANPSVTVTGTTTATIAAGDKVVVAVFIPNSNPTAVAASIGSLNLTEIAAARSARGNEMVTFLYGDATGTIASGATATATWTNTGTSAGGGALMVTAALTPTDTFVSGAPEQVAASNGLSQTPTTTATATPSDTAAKYFGFAAVGAANATAAQVTADNSWTALTEASNVTRILTLDAAALEFTSPPVSAKTETWTTTWGANKAWASALLLFKETSGGGSAPVNTVAPAVTGTTTSGSTLTTTNGTWSNTPTSFTYQWQRDNSGGGTYTNIGSATSSTYVLTGSEVGDNVRCVVTATNASGSASANSNSVGPITSGGGGTTYTSAPRGGFEVCGNAAMTYSVGAAPPARRPGRRRFFRRR